MSKKRRRCSLSTTKSLPSTFPRFLGRVRPITVGTDSRARGSRGLIIPGHDYFQVPKLVCPDTIISAMICCSNAGTTDFGKSGLRMELPVSLKNAGRAVLTGIGIKLPAGILIPYLS